MPESGQSAKVKSLMRKIPHNHRVFPGHVPYDRPEALPDPRLSLDVPVLDQDMGAGGTATGDVIGEHEAGRIGDGDIVDRVVMLKGVLIGRNGTLRGAA